MGKIIVSKYIELPTSSLILSTKKLAYLKYPNKTKFITTPTVRVALTKSVFCERKRWSNKLAAWKLKIA